MIQTVINQSQTETTKNQALSKVGEKKRDVRTKMMLSVAATSGGHMFRNKLSVDIESESQTVRITDGQHASFQTFARIGLVELEGKVTVAQHTRLKHAQHTLKQFT